MRHKSTEFMGNIKAFVEDLALLTVYNRDYRFGRHCLEELYISIC